MQRNLYAIRDAKGEFFNSPFVKIKHGEALRDFSTLANDPKSQIHAFPEDYDLYHLGTYEDESGKIQPLDTPHHLMKAVQVKNSLPTQ